MLVLAVFVPVALLLFLLAMGRVEERLLPVESAASAGGRTVDAAVQPVLTSPGVAGAGSVPAAAR